MVMAVAVAVAISIQYILIRSSLSGLLLRGGRRVVVFGHEALSGGPAESWLVWRFSGPSIILRASMAWCR